LRALESADLGESALQSLGMAPGAARHCHTLAYSATPIDVH
jgi:hypothetical protein